MTLDIINYGFYGFRDSVVASLNLTILGLNQSGPVTTFFFSLKAENNQPVPDLNDSSIRVLYQKTNEAWNSSNPSSNNLFYLGQGAYLVRFTTNDMATPPQIRLFAEDSRGIVVGARTILQSVSDTTGPVTSNVLATPNPTRSASSVTVKATISDAFTGGSKIKAAYCVVNKSNGQNVFTGSMTAVDGIFNQITEAVTTNIDVSGWALGTYTVYVRGQDVKGNWGFFNSTVLSVTSKLKMHVESIVMSIETSGGSRKRADATVTILDENGKPVQGATVTAHWSGGDTGTVSGSTNSQGKVTLYSAWKRVGSGVRFTITIDNVQQSSYTYAPASNKITTKSITT
jgi:hypothetical protein